MEWHYEISSYTWLCGDNNSGCGVYYRDWDNSGWDANVVVEGQMVMLGPFLSKEKAMEEAEKEYENLVLAFS